jgi:hypothetical protein
MWEYRVTSDLGHTDLEKDANKLGAEGWEMLHVQFLSNGWVIGFFKRPKPVEPTT